jgi:hypothetical protein
MRRQAGSGQSVRAWCFRQGLRESSFYWWRRQLARRDEALQTASLVPVRVTAESGGAAGPASRIEITLPDARRVVVIGAVNRQALTDVLAVLASMNSMPPGATAC